MRSECIDCVNVTALASRCRCLRLRPFTGMYIFPLQNVISRNPYPEDPNLVEVKFATTPIMSTYLVAFVIGEYDFVEGQSSDGITVRVYTPVGKAEQGKFALEVSSPPKVTSDRCNVCSCMSSVILLIK